MSNVWILMETEFGDESIIHGVFASRQGAVDYAKQWVKDDNKALAENNEQDFWRFHNIGSSLYRKPGSVIEVSQFEVQP